MPGDHDALQTTRTIAPALPRGHVDRPRLLDALDRATERPFTLVAAPAGTGKTALVSAWAHTGRAPGPVAWVAPDGRAADRRDFWLLAGDAVAAALGTRAPSRRAKADTLLGAFARRALDRDEPLVLVLDDFHELAAAGVEDDLGALLAHPPAALRLVLVTRRDPGLRLARLRVAGTMAELRAADLAFTASEAAELLDRAGVRLTAADAGALWRRTEGWAAGLRLAALGLRDHADPPSFVRAFAGNDGAVADYLLTEVLALLPERTRDFVLRTALPDAICGGLAETLTGGEDGDRMLHDLAHAGAMIAPVEADAGWWRYHPLLRDLLRAELRHAHAAELPALHRSAAAWLAAHDRLGPAVAHAAAGGEVELAAGA